MTKQICSVAVMVAVLASSLIGQSPASSAPPSVAPVQAKRVPGQTSPKTSNQSPAALQSYDFGDQLRVLQDPTAMDSQRSASLPAGANVVPKGYQPRSDIPLSSTAFEAVRVSETWRGGQNTPAAGSDGRVLYAYGAGLPIIVCAPLRVCIIELQPGERITGEPQIGDSVRWNISPAEYGQGEESTSVIVLKPQEPGLDTNLLITTDRRAYYLRLVSKPQEYVARVAFSYPDEENGQKWQQHMLAQRAEAQENNREAKLMPALVTADKLNFSYKVSGGNDQLRPVRVFDDGAKTYIQMSPEVQYREAPVLVVLGAGKKAQKVEITREQHPKG